MSRREQSDDVNDAPGPFGPGVTEDGILIAGRIELRYCVPAPVSEIVLDVARAYLVPDVLALGRRQRVTSLYLDTPQLTFLRWHREHADDRFKLRIRRYGEQSAPTLYAELKRKTGSVVRMSSRPTRFCTRRFAICSTR